MRSFVSTRAKGSFRGPHRHVPEPDDEPFPCHRPSWCIPIRSPLVCLLRLGALRFRLCATAHPCFQRDSAIDVPSSLDWLEQGPVLIVERVGRPLGRTWDHQIVEAAPDFGMHEVGSGDRSGQEIECSWRSLSKVAKRSVGIFASHFLQRVCNIRKDVRPKGQYIVQERPSYSSLACGQVSISCGNEDVGQSLQSLPHAVVISPILEAEIIPSVERIVTEVEKLAGT